MNPIQVKIDEIRRAIRLYVVIDGLARASGVFACGLGLVILLDYLPTRFGFSEFSVLSRGLLLTGLIGLFLFQVYRHLILRVATPISDQNVCLLMERSLPEFSDRLLTAGLTQSASSEHPNKRQKSMLSHLENEIGPKVSNFRSRNVLSFSSISLSLFCFLAPTIVLLGITFAFPSVGYSGFRRALMLSNDLYPRQTQIVDIFFHVVPTHPQLKELVSQEPNSVLATRKFIIAEGSTIELTVAAESPSIPISEQTKHECRLFYQLNDGRSGQTPLPRERVTNDGRMIFSAAEGITQSLDGSGQCWIRVNDAVWGPAIVEFRPSPVLQSVKQNIKYPPYLTTHSIFTDGLIEFVNDSRFPEDTEINFELKFDRPNLQQPYIWNEKNGKPIPQESISLDQGNLSFSCKVTEDEVFRVAVIDGDGLLTLQPTRLAYRKIEDRKPTINVMPIGVGMALTRNAIITLRIEGDDEFGIEKGLFRLSIPTLKQAYQADFEWNSSKEKLLEIDLLQLRRIGKLSIPVEDSKENHVLQLATSISDHHPDHTPAEGQIYEFELVDEKRLVQLIERQEAGLRKRLEEVFAELESARPLLLSASQQVIDLSPSAEESWKQLTEAAPVYIQRARLGVQKSSREIVGIATAFDGLIKQLENNRLNVKTKQLELAGKVKTPLSTFAKTDLGSFLQILVQWNKKITNLPRPIPTGSLDLLIEDSKQALAAHQQLLIKLNRIIQQMVKFESQSELLDSVRLLIDEHKSIMKATEEELERKLFEGILD